MFNHRCDCRQKVEIMVKQCQVNSLFVLNFDNQNKHIEQLISFRFIHFKISNIFSLDIAVHPNVYLPGASKYENT